jgi:hypothetical protein
MMQRVNRLSMNHAALVLASFLLSGCLERHLRTSSFCQPQLYVETFRVDPFGSTVDYLTDHERFRVKVGTCDAEHEDYVYACQGDAIRVLKLDHSTKNCGWVRLPDGTKTVKCDTDTVERKAYSVQALRKNGLFE